MNVPTVSVIIPAYNAEFFLKQTVESVLGQTSSDFEIIIVNDGSTDGTGQVADELAVHNPGSIRVFHTENRGVAAARNMGFSKSVGSLIAFLDADDLWVPEKLSLQVDFLKRNPETSVVFGDAIAIEEDGTLGATMMQFKQPVSGRIFNHLLRENFVSIPTTLLRREAFEGVGGFVENRQFSGVEDYQFWLRLARNHAFAFLPKVLAKYRIRRGSLSSSKVAMWKKCIDMLEDLASGVPTVKTENRTAYRSGLARNWYEMGYHHAGSGDWVQARQCFKQALILRPGLLSAWKGWLALTFLPKALLVKRFDVKSENRLLFQNGA